MMIVEKALQTTDLVEMPTKVSRPFQCWMSALKARMSKSRWKVETKKVNGRGIEVQYLEKI